MSHHVGRQVAGAARAGGPVLSLGDKMQHDGPAMLFLVAGSILFVAVACTAVEAQTGACPGDCDGNGRVDSVEFARSVRALFDPELACNSDATAKLTAAHVTSTIVYAALERPLCAAGRRSRWDALPPLAGGPRQEVGVAAVDGVVYVIGGITGRAVGVATVEAYDVSRGEWHAVAPLPRPLHHVAAAADANFVYTAGGYAGAAFSPVNDVFRYDPQNDAWESLPALPTRIGAAAAAVRGRKLHVVGGGRGLASTSDHLILDLDSLEWKVAAPLPEAVNHLAAVVWNERLYVVGGRRDPSGLNNSAGLYHYEADSDRWQALAPMPTARSGHAAAVSGSLLAVFGGQVDPSRFPSFVYPHVEVYDFERDTWYSDAPMPLARHGFGAATVDGAIFLPGGASRAGFGETAWHDRWVVR